MTILRADYFGAAGAVLPGGWVDYAAPRILAVFTPLLAVIAPVLAPFLAVIASFFATFHPRRLSLGLSARSRQT